VTCLEVRDRLVERSLGALHLEDVAEVDRHLLWCAACRKEAAELDRAASTFALTLAPAAPDPDLEDRVVAAVHAAADARTSRGPTHHGRTAVASVIAAAIAVSSLGWGAAMAGRAERAKQQAADTQRQDNAMIVRLRQLLTDEQFSDSASHAYLATLSPTAGRSGGGSALTWVSPTITDFAIVTVAGLPPGDQDAVPYRVWIVNQTSGEKLQVGAPIRDLDADGGAMVLENSPDLSGFRSVIVTDASGRVVLRGSVGSEAALASPSP
jgi:hypothetical protein